MFITWFSRSSPAVLALYGFLVAGAVSVLAVIVDVAQYITVVQGVQKKVGYADAVNWFYAYLVFWPFCVAALAVACRALVVLPEELCRSGMVRAAATQDSQAIVEQLVQEHMKASLRSVAPFAWMFMILALGLSAWEWWQSSGAPLFTGVEPLDREWDWSNKFRKAGDASRIANSVFALIAFLVLQGGLLVLVGNLVAAAAAGAGFVWKLSEVSSLAHIVPNPRSTEPQKGFEVFRPFVESLLMLSVWVFVILYLSRLWNLFLDDPGSSTFWQFARDNIAQGAARALGKGDIEWLLTTRLTGHSSTFVSMGAAVLFVLLGALIWLSLHQAVTRMRERLNAISESQAIRDKAEVDALRAAADSAVAWPLKAPSINLTLSVVGIALAAIVWYRLGLALAGIALIMLLQRLINRARGKDDRASGD